MPGNGRARLATVTRRRASGLVPLFESDRRREYASAVSGHRPWREIKHKGSPETLDAARVDVTIAMSDQPVLTEEELAAALVHTYGMAPGHAAEVSAAHHGRLHRCLPDV